MDARERIIHEALKKDPNDQVLLSALAVLRGEPQARRESQGLLNVPEACAWLGHVSRTSLWRFRRSGLRAVCFKGRVCYRVKDLEEFADRHLQSGDELVDAVKGGY